MNDRIARLIAWQKFVLTDEGRSEFLQRLARDGDLDEVCREMDLPRGQVVAFLAHHADLDAAADRALKRYSHRLVSETLDIADESGDPKLMVKARMDVAGMYNKPMYGPRMNVDHTVTVGISSALQAISERRRQGLVERAGGEVVEGRVVRVSEPVAVGGDEAVL